MSQGRYEMTSDYNGDKSHGINRPGRNKLPPLEGASHLPPMSSVQSNLPTQTTDQTIISVPDGHAAAPVSRRVHGGVAMPKMTSPNQNKPLEIVVYFMDKTGIHLMVDDGQNCEAGELFEMVMEEMKFPPVARELFSLWLVSDLLEVQLKPTQIPFKLACYWEELCEKYTTAKDDDIERDEAVVMFQRNVFYPLSKEKQITEPELLRLLYHESKENVVDGRYPLDVANYDMLAGLQALINHRTYNPDDHIAKYYRAIISEYYPEHVAVSKKWSLFRGKDAPEMRLADFHHKAFKTYGPLESIEARTQCYKAYLDYCRKLPYYGAAFFKGQIEHPGRRLRLTAQTDDPVYVAINTEGVFIIDMDDVKFLLGLKYKELSWEYAEPKDSDNRNCMPCLFIQFKQRGDDGATVSKLLQIFSREGILMDGLIEAYIKLKSARLEEEAEGETDVDEVDGVMTSGETWADFNRLCLAEFNSQGECIKNNARTVKKK